MELLIRKPGTARPTHDEGDVFAIYPDGGLPEAPAPGSVFWRVIVTGAVPETWLTLLESEYDTTDPNNAILVHRRRRRINWSRVPANIRNTLEATRTVTLASADFKMAWIEQK